MITVWTIPNIFEPEGREGGEDVAGKPVLTYLPPGWCEHDALGILHNDQHLTPYEAARRVTRDEDVVTFWRNPRADLGVAETILIIALLTAVSTGISYGITALTAPSTRSSRKDLEESETYGFGGIVNTVRPGTRIPVVYGTHRVGGHIIQQSIRPGEGEDPKVGVLHTLLGVSHGPIESISDLRIDKNPASDFGSDATFDLRLGGMHQSAIDGFHEVSTQVSKDVQLVSGESTEVTTQNEVDFFELIFRFPGGLFGNHKAGLLQRRVEIKIEHQEEGATPWIQDGIKVISGKTGNAFDAFFRSALLPRAKYKIRLTRLTANDNPQTGFSDSTLFAVNEILDDIQTYPRIALYSVRQLPTNQVSGRTPQYDVLIKGRIVRVYSDVNNYVEEWSDNPAWCALDLLTSRFYGLGAFIRHTDTVIQQFIDFAAFCDAEGFRCNLVLDGSLSAFDAVRQICTIGRAVFLHRGDKWGVLALKPEPIVTQMFTMGRIGKNSFRVLKQSRAEQANLIFGEYLDAALDYENGSLPKEDQTLETGDELVEGTVNLMGATDVAQVNKLLNHLSLANRLEQRVVEFEAGVESIALEAGNVFKIAHDVAGYGFSGKLRAVDGTGTQLWLDRTVTIEAGKSYELTVVHDRTETVDVVVVTSIPGTTDRINVSGDWSLDPDTSLPQIPAAGQHYSFGEVARSTALYRCTAITRAGAAKRRKIRGKQYDPAVYGEDLTVLPAPSPSRLPDPLRIPADVMDLRLAERAAFAQDGSLHAAIDVHFTLPHVAGVRAEVFWRRAGDTLWESAGITSSGYLAITENVESPGVVYEVAVASLSQAGNRKHPGACPRAEISMVGVLRVPDKVVGFRADRTAAGLVFSWQALDPDDNFDLSHYEIRNGTTWDAAVVVASDIRGTTLETGLFAVGTQTYLLKAVNTAGRESFEPAVVVLTVDARIGENIILEQIEDPTFPGTRQNMSVSAGKLTLDTEGALGEWKLVQQQSAASGSRLIPGGFQPGFRVSGGYTTAPFEVTSGAAVRSLVITDIEQLQIDSSLFWTAAGIGDLTWQSEFAQTRAWGVAPAGKVKTKIEMRFSTATSAESDFGPWAERAQNIEVLVKWAQARISVEVLDPSFTVEVSRFRFLFDVPDVTASGTVTTSSTATVPVTFAPKVYNNPPRVAISVLGATSGDTPKHTNVTTTGFDVEVFDSGGSRVVRTVEFIANGF